MAREGSGGFLVIVWAASAPFLIVAALVALSSCAPKHTRAERATSPHPSVKHQDVQEEVAE